VRFQFGGITLVGTVFEPFLHRSAPAACRLERKPRPSPATGD
jgi:hypothetical protein